MDDWTFESWCTTLDSETATVEQVMSCRTAYDLSRMRSEQLTANFLVVALLCALLFQAFLRGR